MKGLCLAGGGVKAAAHIGALKAFEEEKILLRIRNMRNSIIPIFQNAGIRTPTIKHWFTAWDYQKIPDEM